jgi:hypothetical protein
MIKIDASELIKLSKGLEQYKSIFPKSASTQALKKSVRPMFRSAQRLVPTGRRVAASGWGEKKGSDYARGRATARDLRIKLVPAKGNESARVLIGVSKAKGRVGWRTHFITRGFTDRGGRFHRGKDFLQNAYDYTIDIVKDNFNGELLLFFRKWAKRNLPQGRI